MEMDVEPTSASLFGGPLDPMRRSLNDVTAARLRYYHQQCNKRLDATLQLFRERSERPRSRLPHRSLPGGEARASRPVSRVSDRQWKLLRESSDIRVYRQRRRQHRTTTVLASGSVHGSLGEVMNGLYADSTKTARVLELLLSPRALDARVLHVDRRSSEARPFEFAGITWTALKLSGLGFCKHRDFLCFKKMDCFTDDFGDELGYMVLQSLDPLADGDPSGVGGSSGFRTPSSAHFVRGFMSLAVIFKRVADDRVQLFAHGQFNANGRLPPLLGDGCIAEWLTSMANTVQSGQAKNLSRLLADRKQNANSSTASAAGSATASRPRCGVCARALFFWDTPRFCRGCWKPCCRTCRVTKPIFCAHVHNNGASAAAAAPCTETFCLACVCAVIPSGATINARLLKRLAKKRKRAPGPFRPTLTASSATEGSVAPPQLPQMNADRAERLLAAAELSSISVLSSRESEKLQQHRLSLNARPKKRPFVQQPAVENDEEQAEPSSSMLEVLEHIQYRHTGASSFVSGVSSSTVGASLRSFSTSTDLALSSANRLGSFRLNRHASGHSLVTNTGQSFHHRSQLPLALRREAKPLEARGFKATNAPHPPRDDEYYQRMLQNYLLNAQSGRSLTSALSLSSYGEKNAVEQPPPVSNGRSEPQSEPPSDARAASVCSSAGGSSALSLDVAVYRRFK
ncbi:hypothetical protein BBJ28_00008032 [Nothophytophthora sp. Chile5]|nr:hypothetical protein BBJ28_00008032 [Nothophytophthora sp. Chile5]